MKKDVAPQIFGKGKQNKFDCEVNEVKSTPRPGSTLTVTNHLGHAAVPPIQWAISYTIQGQNFSSVSVEGPSNVTGNLNAFLRGVLGRIPKLMVQSRSSGATSQNQIFSKSCVFLLRLKINTQFGGMCRLHLKAR
jgi:hypothetical protein